MLLLADRLLIQLQCAANETHTESTSAMTILAEHEMRSAVFDHALSTFSPAPPDFARALDQTTVQADPVFQQRVAEFHANQSPFKNRGVQGQFDRSGWSGDDRQVKQLFPDGS